MVLFLIKMADITHCKLPVTNAAGVGRILTPGPILSVFVDKKLCSVVTSPELLSVMVEMFVLFCFPLSRQQVLNMASNFWSYFIAK